MNNLYRDLAPVTDLAWAQIEQEAARTFKRHIAGRRVVDVTGPGGPSSAAVSTGHLRAVTAPADGVIAQLRDSKPPVRLRVPFTVTREDVDDVDDVERGAQDSRLPPSTAHLYCPRAAAISI
ncbi:encapsulin [Mycobacterium sp. 852013-50091_SCH5140682]|uniref:encapsulin n=1 Tax=Mycobacterium sp. 852013-50091_SCH5140682 TaxID=1834109 RepID=UPI000A8F8D43|nr:family 1 encapsulin nanocompartment shell protein [Mycobacterium sp. 852013-50091_SCH5140682]